MINVRLNLTQWTIYLWGCFDGELDFYGMPLHSHQIW